MEIKSLEQFPVEVTRKVEKILFRKLIIRAMQISKLEREEFFKKPLPQMKNSLPILRKVQHEDSFFKKHHNRSNGKKSVVIFFSKNTFLEVIFLKHEKNLKNISSKTAKLYNNSKIDNSGLSLS